jgi:hypothetical protein
MTVLSARRLKIMFPLTAALSLITLLVLLIGVSSPHPPSFLFPVAAADEAAVDSDGEIDFFEVNDDGDDDDGDDDSDPISTSDGMSDGADGESDGEGEEDGEGDGEGDEGKDDTTLRDRGNAGKSDSSAGSEKKDSSETKNDASEDSEPPKGIPVHGMACRSDSDPSLGVTNPEDGSKISPRKLLHTCHKFLVMQEEYDFDNKLLIWCTNSIQPYVEISLQRNDICYQDPCWNQVCLMSIVFYGIYFFKRSEMDNDMSLCSQSFLPFVGGTSLSHPIGEGVKRYMQARRNVV